MEKIEELSLPLSNFNTTFIISEENFLSTLNQLENHCKNFLKVDTFNHFKIILSLIFDDNLKYKILSLFICIINKSKDITKNYIESMLQVITEKTDLLKQHKEENELLNLFCIMEINYIILLSLCDNLKNKKK